MTKEEAVKEIEKEEKWLLIVGYSAKNVDIAFDKIKSLISQLLQEPCDTCEHSDEINGSNCYECVKDIRDRYNPQPCEDAIRRTDMLDAIGHGTTYTSEELQRIIKGMPPVNPQEPKTDSWSIKDVADTFKKHGLIREQEPKTGHWIDTNSDRFVSHRVYKCSECDTIEIEYPENIYRHFRYCPDCGAKMVEPQERSE